jgi:hypothetical protein
MAWTSATATQNGNTTLDWAIGPHSSLSTHDAVVIRLDAGGSGVKLQDVMVLPSPTRYVARVQVVGPAAVAFRFAAEQMN